MKIERNPDKASQASYDLLVVGGGIYGATLALESARRNLKPLLLERDDFGGATSGNSLKILHGGLRYLQSLDLHRFCESVAERRWFMQQFPDLVEPLSCLMPLYGGGLQRPAVLRIALLINDYLSKHRNKGVRTDRMLPQSRMLSTSETVSYYPAVDRLDLLGSALWYDAVMPNSQRLFMEILRWASQCGATCLNYVEAKRLMLDCGRVLGLEALDHESGNTLKFRAPMVVNCAGPWCRQMAGLFDRDIPKLFHPSLAFNVFLDRPSLSSMALAVKPKYREARTYFLLPWQGRILAGTYHAPWTQDIDNPNPNDKHLTSFLNDLNSAVPDLELHRSDVLRIHSGFMPVTKEGSVDLADREVLHDHGAHNGPQGLFSVSGVKFTTARRVAEKTLQMIYGRSRLAKVPSTSLERPSAIECPSLKDFSRLLQTSPEAATAFVRRMINEEAVVHLDDMFIRRTDWENQPRQAIAVADRLCQHLGWDGTRRNREIARLEKGLALRE